MALRLRHLRFLENSYVASSSSNALASFRSRVSKPFGEPAVGRSEKLASLIPLALIAPEPRHAHCGAEFPGLRLLRSATSKRAVEIPLRFRCIGRWRLQRDFARHAIDLGFRPLFLGRFYRCYGFADAAPSVIKSVKLRVSNA